MKKKSKVNKRTLRDSIRGSVPDGKLKKARILLRDGNPTTSNIGGFTEYDPKNKDVIKLGAPMGDGAFDITIRGHETRHATRHKPQRKKPMTQQEALAAQIVDDSNIEQTSIPYGLSPEMLEVYRRAHLATAVNDVRTMLNQNRAAKAGKRPDNAELHNANLCLAVRSLSMLQNYREGSDSKTLKQSAKAMRRVKTEIGMHTANAIQQIINTARSPRNRNKAISMLLSLFEPIDAEDNDGEKLDLPEMETDDGEMLSPVVHGDSLEGEFTIKILQPMNAATSREKTIARRYTPDGVIINPARFVNAIVSHDANGLFARRLKFKSGGTVVIDASGSMGATAENLSALCNVCPTATVAYYSGNDRGKGMLTVFAHKGKRFDGQLPEETLQGGNAVDLAAVRWLLACPKPWTLVSDLEFCGGVLGSEAIAHALVEREQRNGDLTVYRSLDAAYEAFGGKGDLGDMGNKRGNRLAELRKIMARIKAEKEATLRAKEEADRPTTKA